jgi:hypothetical protein
VTPAEMGTFDSNNNNVRGDLEDVLACLDHQINYDPGNGARGNYQRFLRCSETCSPSSCGLLPRSLLPNFNTTQYVEGGLLANTP